MSEELKIEKGIELPKGANPLTDALKKMEKGDSVFAPGVSSNEAHSAALQLFGKSGQISVRKMDGGVRVWKL